MRIHRHAKRAPRDLGEVVLVLSARDEFCSKQQIHHALMYGSRSESASPEA